MRRLSGPGSCRREPKRTCHRAASECLSHVPGTRNRELQPNNGLTCTHHRYYHFTVRVGLEVVGLLELLAQDPMVVDFAIDCKCDGAIIVD